MRNGPYIFVRPPDDYPGKRYRGKYAYEHHVVYWRKFGVVPSKSNKEIVHHKNGIKTDNRISNLELLSQKEHRREHNPGPTMVQRTCEACGIEFSRQKRMTDHGRYFCCRSHQISVQMKEKWNRYRSEIGR